MYKKFDTLRRVGRSGLLLLGAIGTIAAVHAFEIATSSTPAAARGGWTGVQPALAAPPDGEQLYMTRCMSCHQMNGQGIPGVFPPLDGTTWVTDHKGRLIRLVLHGLTGEVTVKDVKYSGAMPPWGTFLNDEEIAAVLTYIRTSWSNEAGPVTAEEVAKVRAATADRKQPWTAAELDQEANQGIPE